MGEFNVTWVDLAVLASYVIGTRILMLALSGLTMAVVSAATPPPRLEHVRDCLWSRSLWDRESVSLARKPWYQNYRVLSAGLLCLTAAIVIWWW